MLKRPITSLSINMKPSIQRFSALLVILLLFSACKATKAIKGSATADPSLKVKTIIASHNEAYPNFNTLAGRMYVSYEDAKQSQGVTVSLRMEKDKKIWVKASVLGITGAKMLITPTSVQFYETLNNTYFDGDFKLLSEWLGTEIDFEKAQAILLGQSIFNLNGNNYSTTVANNKYRLTPKKNIGPFVFSLLLNPDAFKVSEEIISQPTEKRRLKIRYEPYQLIEKDPYPTKVFIDVDDNGAQTKIEMEYRKIDVNANVGFPFKIPKGYKEIKF